MNLFLAAEIFLILVFYPRAQQGTAICQQAALDFPVAEVDGSLFISNLRC